MYRCQFRIKKDTEFVQAEEVEEFLSAERAEVTYHPRYQGLYDNRLILPGNVRVLARTADEKPWELARLIEAQATLYPDEVGRRTKRFARHCDDLKLLEDVRDGRVKLDQGEFELGRSRYHRSEVKRPLRQVNEKLDEDERWLSVQDQQVFVVYYHMARHLGEHAAFELVR